jgi:hypothetical protein
MADPMTNGADRWRDETGLIALPSGVRVRGRRVTDPASPADFALLLAGGVGRTGTALAALAILDGVPAAQAVNLIRADYHRRAVETPWQRRWLRSVH